ncbi:MAG TPA: site-specific integrase [Candidatus Binataceae bacterium]|nr:site-specific integrase [Candidatus Binataceae bacterium]
MGDWPRLPPPQNAIEALIAAWLAEYRERLGTYCDLASGTVVGRLEEAKRFLVWCQERGALGEELDISIADVDAYVQHRASHMRRVTCAHMTRLVRVFLQFLRATGKVPEDLSARVIGPTLYQYESIPSILDADQVAAVLRHAHQDRSRKGQRDYAILMLLATYGLRGGELVRMQLSDVDWRRDTLSIFHTKTRTYTTLPLLPAVGEALLAYLRHARGKVTTREIFLRMKAPFKGLKRASCLNGMIREHLAAAGVRPPGKSGSHLFRHARAVALLRGGVPVKTISDVLGHRSVRSTSVYLKLHYEELRSVALPLPSAQGGAP